MLHSGHIYLVHWKKSAVKQSLHLTCFLVISHEMIIFLGSRLFSGFCRSPSLFSSSYPVLRLSMASSTPFWLLRIMYWCMLG